MNSFKKKTISLFLTAMLLLSAFPLNMLVSSALTYGDFTYTVNEDGEAVITKCNALANRIVSVPGEISGSKVTEIGESAFCDCKYITEIIIPDTVEKIGDYAFGGINIEKVTFGRGVSYIGKSAFYGCEKLTSLDLRGFTLAFLGEDAFAWCRGLTEVYFPGGQESVPAGCFCGCSSLATVNLPEGVKSVSKLSFSQCSSIKQFTFPKGFETISSEAFSGCSSLKDIFLPASFKKIESKAFDKCVNMTSVHFRGTVTSWQRDVEIGENNQCIKDARIYFSAGDTDYLLVNESVYIVSFGGNAAGEIEIPEEIEGLPVTGIFAQVLKNCPDVTSLIIPKGITDIDKRAFTGSCLTSVTVSEDNPAYASADGVLYSKDMSVLVYYPPKKDTLSIPASIAEIGDYAFAGSSFEEIVIPMNVVSVGASAFEGSSVVSFTGADKLVAIKENTFKDCLSLRSVKLYTSIKHIDVRAFSGCSSLEEITYIGNAEEKTLEKMKVEEGNDLFLGCDNISYENIFSQRQAENIYVVKKSPDSMENLTVFASFSDGSEENVSCAVKQSPLPGGKTLLRYNYKGKTISTVL